MLYIKLEENLINKPSLLSNFINRFKLKKLKVERVENRTLITITKIDGQTMKKILKFIKTYCINSVCLSDNLLSKKDFVDIIKSENIRIYDGRWLFKHLAYKCIYYVVTAKKENIEMQEISILSNDINRMLVSTIREVAPRVKAINVITGNEHKFRKLEEELYLEKGIIINMNNNYKKSLIKSDIILNFDFAEQELYKYNLPVKACIINFNEEIIIDSKLFKGIICNYFDITMPNKYIKNCIYFSEFKTPILYESFIYKNTSPDNIKKELEEDNVNINSLIGNKGKIRKSEFNNLSKKVTN